MEKSSAGRFQQSRFLNQQWQKVIKRHTVRRQQQASSASCHRRIDHHTTHGLLSISAWDTLKIGVHGDGIALCKPAKDTTKHHHHHNPLWSVIIFNWIQFNQHTATSEILGRSCAGAPRFWLSARKIRDTCHSWQQCTVLTPTCSWSFSCFTLHTGMHWMGQKDTDRMTKFLVLGKQSIWRRVLLLWYNHTRAESAMKKIGRYYWAGLRYLCVRC